MHACTNSILLYSLVISIRNYIGYILPFAVCQIVPIKLFKQHYLPTIQYTTYLHYSFKYEFIYNNMSHAYLILFFYTILSIKSYGVAILSTCCLLKIPSDLLKRQSVLYTGRTCIDFLNNV